MLGAVLTEVTQGTVVREAKQGRKAKRAMRGTLPCERLRTPGSHDALAVQL